AQADLAKRKLDEVMRSFSQEPSTRRERPAELLPGAPSRREQPRNRPWASTEPRTSAAPGPLSDSDLRLRELEAKMEQIMAELQGRRQDRQGRREFRRPDRAPEGGRPRPERPGATTPPGAPGVGPTGGPPGAGGPPQALPPHGPGRPGPGTGTPGGPPQG